MKRFSLSFLAIAALTATLLATPALAVEVVKSYDFALDEWQPVEFEEGTISLHQMRIQRVEGRITKSALQRPYNQAYLQTVQLQVEYTNSGTKNVKARLEVEWLDDEGRIIDGFSAIEDLDKKSSHKMTRTSMSTIAYGLERAATVNVRISYEPQK